MTKTGLFLVVLAGVISAAGHANSTPPVERKDARVTLIHNVLLVDGTGGPARAGAVRIRGDRIVEVGALEPRESETLFDGEGNVLAPGFIDSHSHHDRGMLDSRDVVAASSQGITTIIVGQDGGSRLPLSDFIDKVEAAPPSINIASYTGHNTLRDRVLADDGRRAATPAEIERMKSLLREDMAAGSFGLSTGLGYETGVFSTTDEVVELATVAAEHGGRYISHIRNENVEVFAAIREAIEVGRRSRAPVQISHIKLGAVSTWGQADRAITLLEEAREDSVEVSADIYPYTYWQTTMGILFPDKNYDDAEGIRWAFEELLPPGNVLLTSYAPNRHLEGMTIAEIASKRQEDPAEVYVDLMQDSITWSETHDGRGESIIGTSMAEADVAALMAWRGTNICSDGASSGGHPRGYGSFPRVLGRYVRENGVLGLEEAVHKMTGLTASHLGIENRGMILPAMYADLVLFDPAIVEDRARIGDSTALSNGILNVWVNGRTIFANGSPAGIYAGRFLMPRAKNSAAAQ